jgi:type IV pilus assembly protein PilX
MSPVRPLRQPGRGFSLLTVLIMMVVLAFIGLGAMNSSLLQERMAGNANDQNVALQAAEAALRDAERDVGLNLPTPAAPAVYFPEGCRDGLCGTPSMLGKGSAPVADSVNWNDTAAVRVYGSRTGSPPLPGVHQQPRYVIELLPPPALSGQSLTGSGGPAGALAYRVTVHATGLRDSTVVQLQSTFVVQQ